MARISSSKHLETLLTSQSGAVDAQIVFLDIVSYSKRRSTTQRQVVERFQADLKTAINDAGKNNIDYIQNNNINLSNDVVIIPTGDGAAVAFSFNGLQTVGLEFAISILRISYEARQSRVCDRYTEQGWCNCHAYYSVRIGINEGKNILYTDANDQINVAGTCINEAARIMGRADAQQILLSQSAYENLVDMTNDLAMEEKIVNRGTVRVKHGKEIPIFQYVGMQEPFIERAAPVDVALEAQMTSAMSKMGMGDMFKPGLEIDKDKIAEMATVVGEMIEKFGFSPPSMPMKSIDGR